MAKGSLEEIREYSSLVWKSGTTKYGFIKKCFCKSILLLANQVSYYSF
jgi:hypothetical protein